MKMKGLSLDQALASSGLKLIRKGKVRDLYLLDKENILIVTTNRISIFDFVLSAAVPFKGEILNALSTFWLCILSVYSNHNILGYGYSIDLWLPDNLAGNKELQKYAIVVRDQKPLPIELIVRGYLTGSGWKSYEEDGSVYGYRVGPDLHDGSRLPEPILTPTTKADSGHDKPIMYDQAAEICSEGSLRQCIELYTLASAFALNRGIIIADTKFEMSEKGFIDEILTPDSSRFWKKNEWQDAAQRGESPQGYDKQPVRNWGKTVKTPWGIGIDNLDPEMPEHVNFVLNLKVPKDVIKDTTKRYREIFRLLTGMELEEYQTKEMGIAL